MTFSAVDFYASPLVDCDIFTQSSGDVPGRAISTGIQR
jgi:hypothetical protein